MGVGDGNGALPIPDRAQKALVHEVRRADLNQLAIDPANASQIIVEQVLPEDVGGWWLREIGIYDEAGDLCAVANCPPSYKPLMVEGSGRTQVVRVVLIVTSTAAIELKIDPSVVLATRKYADDQMIEVRAYADTLLAQHLAALDPHPQYKPKELAMLSKSVAGKVDVVLTAAEGKADVLNFTGLLTGNISVIVPAAARSWAVHNKTTGAFSLTLRTEADAGQAIAQGRTRMLYCDGANVLPGSSDVGRAVGEAAPSFDNSHRLATTEWVNKNGVMLDGIKQIGTPRAITVAESSALIYIGTGCQNGSIALPDATKMQTGRRMTIACNGKNVTLTRGRINDQVYGVLPGGIPSIDFKMNVGDTVVLIANAEGAWYVESGTIQNLGAAQSDAVLQPYQQFPGGMILQWGGGAQTPASGYVDVIFPIPFPNACFHVFTGYEGQGGSGANLPSNINTGMKTKTGCRLFTYNGNALSAGITPSYFAIGN